MKTADQLFQHYDTNLKRFDAEMTSRYGERYTEYRIRYANAGRFEYEPDFPLYLMLEQTYSCNLRCPACIHGMLSQKNRFNTNYAVMPRTIFDRIILEGEQYNCPSIAFMVNDEPLLVKDLPERVAFAKEHGFMDLFITTNGNLLYPDVMKRLIDAGVTRILFSLDAATAQTYKKVRPEGDFFTVIENLEALLDYKKVKDLVIPAVRVSFVVSRLNIHEKGLFVKTFASRVDYLEIQAFSSYYDVNTDLIPPGAKRIEDYQCTEPWRKLIIRPNGDVLPCCLFYGYEIVLGNCLQTSLRDIFLGLQCRQLRSEFKEGVYRLKPCSAYSKSLYMN